jgi:hypothetical protein
MPVDHFRRRGGFDQQLLQPPAAVAIARAMATEDERNMMIHASRFRDRVAIYSRRSAGGASCRSAGSSQDHTGDVHARAPVPLGIEIEGPTEFEQELEFRMGGRFRRSTRSVHRRGGAASDARSKSSR